MKELTKQEKEWIKKEIYSMLSSYRDTVTYPIDWDNASEEEIFDFDEDKYDIKEKEVRIMKSLYDKIQV